MRSPILIAVQVQDPRALGLLAQRLGVEPIGGSPERRVGTPHAVTSSEALVVVAIADALVAGGEALHLGDRDDEKELGIGAFEPGQDGLAIAARVAALPELVLRK